MPKKAVSAQERMDREFRAALRAGQARVGDRDIDTAKLLPHSYSTFCRRKRFPGTFEVDDLRVLAKRYNLTDYQLCQIIGVKYRGLTAEQEAAVC